MMKNLKVKLSVFAMIIGLGGAFATIKPLSGNHKWGRDASSGAYTDITGQVVGTNYSCSDAATVCTATYAEGVDPNSNPANPISTELGDFQ